MPLRKPMVQTTRAEQPAGGEVMGALYVDSRFASHDITSVSHDILRAIATEAAQLIENARLVQAEEAGRRYQQEWESRHRSNSATGGDPARSTFRAREWAQPVL